MQGLDAVSMGIRLLTMHQSFQYRIYPTEDQKRFLSNHFGATRFVYNYFLALRKSEYEAEKKSSSFYADCNRLVQLKHQGQYSWMYEIGAQTLREPLRNLDTAYKSFFKGKSKFPHFHKRHNEQCIKIPEKFKIKEGKLHIPKLKTGIKIKLHREIQGKICFLSIRKTATNKYYASFTCEVEKEALPLNENIVGIDLGIKNLLITSNNQTFNNQKHFHQAQNKLAYHQRQTSKKKKGSNNQQKQRRIVSQIHENIRNKRHDNLHKISKKLIDENQVIIVETLNVKGMVQNHCLAKSISDCAWGTLLQFIDYKARWYGRTFHQIDRWFPSSKTCNECQFVVDDLPLNVREWQCPHCQAINDRDLNAAKNIRDQGIKDLKALSGVGITSDIKQKLGEAPALVGSMSQEDTNKIVSFQMCNARRFHFLRKIDVSGVSGTGDNIAFGCEFSDGTIALHWEGELSSINIYKSSKCMLQIHGHNGATDIVWDDPPFEIKDGNNKE